MQLIKGKISIDFMGKRKLWMGLSIALILISIISLATRGLNLGIDFSGGYLIEVGFPASADLEPIRQALVEDGFSDALVQHFGSSRDVLVRLAPREGANKADISDQILQSLQNTTEETISMRRVEFVGPQVGEELREQGGMALLLALIGILIYISLRFQLKSAVGAVLALVHDVIITLGIFSMLQLEFDLTVLAAILAVIGYSLNDTVVVLDRIRENFRSSRKDNSESILNGAVNQTLSRTLMSSLTTLFVLFALFFFGGEAIRGFSTALIVGIFVGTYSSIYIAASMLMVMNVSREDFFVEIKETTEEDERP